MVDNSQQEEHFLSDSKDNNKNENLEISFNNSPTLRIIPLNKVTSTNSIHLDDNIE